MSAEVSGVKCYDVCNLLSKWYNQKLGCLCAIYNANTENKKLLNTGGRNMSKTIHV